MPQISKDDCYFCTNQPPTSPSHDADESRLRANSSGSESFENNTGYFSDYTHYTSNDHHDHLTIPHYSMFHLDDDHHPDHENADHLMPDANFYGYKRQFSHRYDERFLILKVTYKLIKYFLYFLIKHAQLNFVFP